MNENIQNTTPETPTEPPQYSWSEQKPTEESESPVMLRRKIKKGYGKAAMLIIWQQLFAIIIMVIISSVMSVKLTGAIMAENPEMSPQELTQAVTDGYTEFISGENAIFVNAGTMIVANLLSLVIVCAGKKQFKLKRTIGKIDMPASTVVLACIGILGIQGVSIYIQNFVMSITGYTGLNESTASAMTYTDNIAANIVLFFYLVIAAPVIEELMFRGTAMNLLAPVNRKFALFASALLFGLMHSNFNQIFNGFLLGLLLGYIALKSGSVVTSILCHMTANLNAALVSFIFEYKLAPSIGSDAAATGEMIVFAVEAVVGIIALVVLLKKNGKLTDSDIIVPEYSYIFEDGDAKKLTWLTLIKCPSFWVAAAYCIFSAVILVSAV